MFHTLSEFCFSFHPLICCSRFGYGLAGSQTDNEENDEVDSTDNESENSDIVWRKRRSADRICRIKKYSYRPEILISEPTRTRSLDISHLNSESVLDPECFGRQNGHKFVSGRCRSSFFECINVSH